MRFTDRSIAALKPKAERYEEWEDGRSGFGVRVATSGRKSFIFMYRFDGKARRMTLGTYSSSRVSLADARVRYAKARQRKEQGFDPGAEHTERRKAERDAETVADLIEVYLEKHARPNKRSSDADERILRKEVLPRWGSRKAKTITRRDVNRLLDEIVDRGSPVMANRTLAVVRRMFNFAIERDILDASPCVMIKAPAKETPRDRVMSPAEVSAFWHGLDKAKMSDQVRLALKLMLVTAQRRDEVVCASWAELDLAERGWEIPGSRTKNGRAHRVPLSPLAVGLLDEIREKSSDSKWLFPSPRGGKSITPAAVSHAVGNNLEAIGVAGITPHDLRRSAASHMTELGVSRLVVSKILNHTDSSVTGVYDRYEYGPEKRHALEAWGGRLQEIISGKAAQGNVVALRPA